MKTVGVVFGYEIASDLAFSFTRAAGSGDSATGPLVVEQGDPSPEPSERPLLEWLPRPEHPFHARLHALDDERYSVWIEGTGGFVVDPHTPRVLVPAGADPIRREERLWGIPAALCMNARGSVPLHGAAVEVDGRAVAFVGPGRFGKTTIAARFHADGYRVLSEDIVCVRTSRASESPTAVLPGPAVLRVRPDVAAALPLPGAAPVSTDPERVHLQLDAARRGTGDPVPLAAIVLLRRGTPDVQLYRVAPERWLPELFGVSFNVPTDADRARSFHRVADLAFGVPLWLLDRPLRFDTLDEVVERVISTCLS